MRIRPQKFLSKPQAQKLTETVGDPDDPSISPNGETVIFSSGFTRPSSREVFSVGADGQEQLKLTKRGDNMSYQPSISPDGKKIAYLVGKDGKTDLHVMNLDGSGDVNLTRTKRGYWSPTWSPDSKTIVTTSRDTLPGNLELVSLAADGSKRKQLTHRFADTENPVYAPSGEHIVFGLGGGLGSAILCSIRSAGGGFKSYASELQLSDKPAVSKDGVIAFSATDGDGKYGLYTAKLESDDPAKLIVDYEYAFEPCFSADGSKIVFSGAKEGHSFQIYEVNTDGSDLSQVTDGEGFNSSPAYSQDGSSIVFLSDRDGKNEVYKMETSA